MFFQPKQIPQQSPADTPLIRVRAANEAIAYQLESQTVIGSTERHGKEVIPGARVKKVVIWDKDERHPDGELFLSGFDIKLAFPTGRIKELLREEKLVVIGDDGKVINWKPNK